MSITAPALERELKNILHNLLKTQHQGMWCFHSQEAGGSVNTLSCNLIKVIGREKYSMQILSQRLEKPKAEKKKNPTFLSFHKMLCKKCLKEMFEWREE